MSFLNGWKTYLGFGLIGVAAILGATGKVPPELQQMVYGLGVSLAGVGIGHKLAKLANGNS